MMRIYLDNCVLNRPFDDMSQPRIWFETLALSFVLSLVEFREAEMARSAMHEVENRRNPDAIRRAWVDKCLKLATNQFNTLDHALVTRARQLESVGFKVQDALHVASAEALQVDYFLTCDDAVVKRYSGPMKALNPTTFITTLN